MQRIYLCLGLLISITCTSSVHTRAPLPKESTPPVSRNSQQSTSQVFVDSSKAKESLSVPVSQWTGLQFYVLTKQDLIKSSGYNLYSCLNTDCASIPVDDGWELPNRRIRCDQIENDTLPVQNVTSDSGEWIITFIHQKSGKTIFGKTHNQAIMEVAPLEDLGRALKRWRNSYVFSKKGTMLIQKNQHVSSIASFRVNILDSLLVTDAVWGMTPLPVKPIWLSVTQVSSGKTGFIPVRYSWTNTPADQVKENHPWDDDIFETDPRDLFPWDSYTWEVINNHHVILEMTPEQVELSWGPPKEISGNLISSGSLAYTYPSHILIFENRKLVRIDPVN